MSFFPAVRVLAILQVHTLTTAKVLMECLQILPIPRVQPSTLAPKLRRGLTLGLTLPLSSNSGRLASSHRLTTTATPSDRRTLRPGLGPALELRRHTNPRWESI